METLSTKDVAAIVDTTPKTLRKFLRSQAKEAGGTVGEDTPGKGGRYSFEKKEVAKIKREFSAWSEAQAQKRAERLAAQAAAEEEVEDELEDELVED